jgi:hypothetical protein
LKEYISGIDWGYKYPIIKEILDSQERFVIITHPGSIEGQGTAMGAGGYYYSKTRHWVADTFLEGNLFNVEKNNSNIIMPRTGRATSEVEGRLTKENKKKLLEELEEYKKLNNIQ